VAHGTVSTSPDGRPRPSALSLTRWVGRTQRGAAALAHRRGHGRSYSNNGPRTEHMRGARRRARAGSIYRHLAHWPGYLGLAAGLLRPLHEGELERLADRALAGARRWSKRIGPSRTQTCRSRLSQRAAHDRHPDRSLTPMRRLRRVSPVRRRVPCRPRFPVSRAATTSGIDDH
jgi:hypothetical protein